MAYLQAQKGGIAYHDAAPFRENLCVTDVSCRTQAIPTAPSFVNRHSSFVIR
jgi:hypothetical protein